MDSGTSLAGKRIVIVGGASGIGAAVAELATARGGSVVVASRRTGLDLRDEATVDRFFATTGPFDHLVITAGDWDFPIHVRVPDLDLAAAQYGLTVRFWGALAAVKHASRTIARDGSIALTSGMLAHRPAKGAPLAAAIGGAIEHLARGLAVDLAPIRVNAVCPGLVLTDVVKQMPEASVAAMVERLPVPRTASPAEAAQAYVYLMLNGYTTGQILPVEGGGLLQ